MTVTNAMHYRHGTVERYKQTSCRCDDCRGAWAMYTARRAKARRDSPPAIILHGRAVSYRSYGCRCDRCRAAFKASRAASRESK